MGLEGLTEGAEITQDQLKSYSLTEIDRIGEYGRYKGVGHRRFIIKDTIEGNLRVEMVYDLPI